MHKIVLAVVLIASLAACGGGSGGSSSPADTKQFCDDIKAFTTVGTDIGSDNPDLAKASALFAQFGDVADEAPAAIQDDVAVVNQVFQKLSTELAKTNDPQDALSAFLTAASSVDPAKLSAAGQKVQSYVKSTCDIDIDLSLAGAATTTTTGSGDTTTTVADSTTTTGADADTTTTAVTGGNGGSTVTTPDTTDTGSTDTTGTTIAMPPPTDPPTGDDPELPGAHDLAVKCHDGDMQACDDLYDGSTIGSDYETYGNTCGGRLPNTNDQYCVDVFGPGTPQ